MSDTDEQKESVDKTVEISQESLNSENNANQIDSQTDHEIENETDDEVFDSEVLPVVQTEAQTNPSEIWDETWKQSPIENEGWNHDGENSGQQELDSRINLAKSNLEDDKEYNQTPQVIQMRAEQKKIALGIEESLLLNALKR